MQGKRDADGKTALDLAKDTGVVELHDVLRRAMSEQDEEEEEEEEKDMLAESDDEVRQSPLHPDDDQAGALPDTFGAVACCTGGDRGGGAGEGEEG